jgi:hypothetical protein
MSNAFDHGHGGHGGGGGEELLCYFHPRELLVGVCAHCLRERLLLLLASKEQGGGRERVPADGASYLSARPYRKALRRVRTGSIVSAFAIGSSLLHRLDSSRHHTHDVVHGDGSGDGDKINPDADDTASVASLDGTYATKCRSSYGFVRLLPFSVLFCSSVDRNRFFHIDQVRGQRQGDVGGRPEPEGSGWR